MRIVMLLSTFHSRNVHIAWKGDIVCRIYHPDIHISPSISLLQHLHQHARLARYHLHSPRKYISNRQPLLVEIGILIVPLQDDRTINLCSTIQSSTLDIAEHGFLAVFVQLRLQNATRSQWTCDNRHLTTERNTHLAESVHCSTIVEHKHAVIDVDASHESYTNSMNEDPGWRRPRSVVFASDENSGSTGCTDPHAGAPD